MKTHDAGEAQATALAGLGGSCPQCDHSPGGEGHEYPPTGWEVSPGKLPVNRVMFQAMLDLPEALPNSRRVFSNINWLLVSNIFLFSIIYGIILPIDW
jgi:hypothetical protein